MFNLPKTYIVNQTISKSTFTGILEKTDRTHFGETVKSVTLVGQITDESIPSLIDTKYKVQAILFFEVQIDKLANANFVANTMQEAIKGYAVIQLYEGGGNMQYSLATKRLNENDNTSIVIEGKILTETVSNRFDSKLKQGIAEYCDFDKILNITDKRSWYFELMAKLYILSNINLCKQCPALLDSKIWYNLIKTQEIFALLRQIEKLKSDIKTASLTEQVLINGEIKLLLQGLIKYE